MKLRLLLLTLTTVLFTTSATAQLEALTTSEDGLVYSNDKFGVTITKPESWYAQEIAEIIATQQMGADLMAGDDENMQAILDNSLDTTLPLFGFFESAPGAPVSSNASLIGVAENISMAPGLESACDYLYHARQLMARSQIRTEMQDECLTYEVDGSTLHYFNAVMDFGAYKVHQKYLACLSGDHALAFVYSMMNTDNVPALDNMVKNLQVKCD
ncbi:hypothetical protein QTP81_10070 [Alteromonas sp. ASW11-36]|uniref:Uncharacterized protein n=1 Tax=Alteromonas arenosi TaxID=3055817 RepID=A0ABT7SZG8_9ALTE|nr:hypothetical protein [Alteromonas sp. ASW11-36]MDM7860942.1 hypothetical protein [Alteromonas sp. ASW11-36]